MTAPARETATEERSKERADDPGAVEPYSPAENPSQTQYVTNPYTGAGGWFGGPDPTRVMQSFPWDRLQLVKMDLRTTA